MKTAMQELEDWANKYKGQMISADQVVLKAHNLLIKEKEQIIDAYYGKINGVFGYREEGQEYYNQTYNTKQHIIDIMKADEEDGLYNETNK